MESIKTFFGAEYTPPSAEQLTAFEAIEKQLDVHFPESVKAFLINCQDLLIDDQEVYFPTFFDVDGTSTELTELSESFDLEELKETEVEDCPPEIRPRLSYHKKWIPFLVDSGLYLLFDLDPTAQGQAGQIILWDSMAGQAPELVAESLDIYLEKINAYIEQGGIEVAYDSGHVELTLIDDSIDMWNP